MTEKEVFLSTIIPVYNAEKYLERCLNSVLYQEVEGCEVICVDDGSSDGTPEILEKYARKYSNIRYIQQENRHAGIARNIGLEYANGRYIHFMDADDYLFPGFHAKLRQILQDRTVDYIKFRNQAFDLKTNEEVKNVYYSLDDIPDDLWGKEISFYTVPDFFLKSSCTPWTGVVNKEFILRNGISFNDLICCNDRSFYIQVLCSARSILLCNFFGVYHQINNKESLVGIRKFHFECHFYSYKLIEKITKNVEFHLRQKIMGGELRDLLSWYENLDSDEVCQWNGELSDFFKQIDILALDFNMVPDYLLCQVLDKCGLNPLETLPKIYNNSDVHRLFTNSSSIYLYGAGKVAKAFLSRRGQEEYKKNILGIFVTSLENEMENIYGVPICLPESIREREEICVVVATSRRYQIAIYSNLYQKGFRNILLFSDEFCEELLRCIEM